MKKILISLLLLSTAIQAQTVLTLGRIDTIWKTGQVPKGLNNTNTWYTLFARGAKNPTSGYIPYNNAGVFADSKLHQDSNGSVYNLGLGDDTTNTGFGKNALISNNGGVENSFYGFNSGSFTASGSYNTSVGSNSFTLNTIGQQNTSVGEYGMFFNTIGSYNASFGVNSLFNDSTGSYNTSIGNFSLASCGTCTGNIGLGYSSGYYEQGNNKLYINNSQITGDSLHAIIYGYMNDTISKQRLRLNANVYIGTPPSQASADSAVSKLLSINIATGKVQQRGLLPLNAGSFTPIFSDSANVDSVTSNIDAMYTRVGNIVNVQYSLYVDPTVTLTPTTLHVTLPIDSNPSASLAGQGSFNQTNISAVFVTPVDSQHALITFYPIATSSTLLNFSITYRAN